MNTTGEKRRTKSPPRGWFVLKKAKSLCRYEFRCRTTAEEEDNESISSVVFVASTRNHRKLLSPNIEVVLPETLPSLQDLLLSALIHGALRGAVAPWNPRNVLHVCIQLTASHRPSWFSLWIKPDQTLTNNIWKRKKMSSANTLLVPIPSSFSPRVPMFVGEVGSALYAISKYNTTPSSVMWARYKSHAGRKAPSMTVARANAFACVFDEKIYVMGGCPADDESSNWAEVFDPKTQTWEPLPDPGAELRVSSIKKVEVIQGKISLKSIDRMEYVYDPKDGEWDAPRRVFEVESKCEIENVRYRCGRQDCLWYDTKRNEWREVKGLASLNRNRRCDFVETANYGGKLLILWEKYAPPRWQNKNIWCAVIALERHRRNDDDEVWGKVDWASVIRTVPSSYVFLRCEVKPV